MTIRLALFAGSIGIGVLLWNHAKIYDHFARIEDQQTKAAEITSFFQNYRLKLLKLSENPIYNDVGRYTSSVDGVWIAEAAGTEHTLLQPQQVRIQCMINALYDEHKKGECAELTVTFGAMKGMVSIMGPEQMVYEVTQRDKDSLVASATDEKCRLHVLTMSFALGRVSVSDIPTNKQGCEAFTETNSYQLVRGQYYVDTSEKRQRRKQAFTLNHQKARSERCSLMNSEQSIKAALNRIIKDAASQKVDFAAPDNAFTVWADLHNRMQYCGGQKTLEAAWILAGDHPSNRYDLYIVNAQIKPFGILTFHEG